MRDERFDAAPASLTLAVRRQQLNEHYAKQLAEIAVVDDEVQTARFASKLPGDEKALRGIPAIGRGVTGAIPRTRPGDGLDAYAGRPDYDVLSTDARDVASEPDASAVARAGEVAEGDRACA